MAKKIMVVDDEEDIRSTVKSLLEKNRYEVITAINGDDCLQKLAKNKVDLILMDIMMPGTPVKKIIPKTAINAANHKIDEVLEEIFGNDL